VNSDPAGACPTSRDGVPALWRARYGDPPSWYSTSCPPKTLERSGETHERDRVRFVSDLEERRQLIKGHVGTGTKRQPFHARDVANRSACERVNRIDQLAWMRPVHHFGKEEDLGLDRHILESPEERRAAGVVRAFDERGMHRAVPPIRPADGHRDRGVVRVLLVKPRHGRIGSFLVSWFELFRLVQKAIRRLDRPRLPREAKRPGTTSDDYTP
jgi:hypothetical protein